MADDKNGMRLNASSYRKVNLRKLGFTTASDTKADPAQFEGMMQSLYAGAYLDENLEIGLTVDARQMVQKRLETLDGVILDLSTDLNEIKITKTNNLTALRELRQAVNNAKSGKSENGEVIEHLPGGMFNLPVFLFTSIPCLGLTVYLVMFYISVTYRALLLSTTEIAQQIAKGVSLNNVLPGKQEIANALEANPIILVAPVIFIAMGIALHFTMFSSEAKGKQRLWGWLCLAVCFVFDVALALAIHNRLNAANALIGQPESAWYVSSDFYLIILLGFVVFFFWSFLFHLAFAEWQKRNIAGRQVKHIRDLTKENERNDLRTSRLLAKKQSSEDAKAKLQGELDGVWMYVKDLRTNMTVFHAGWKEFIKRVEPDLNAQGEAADKIIKRYHNPRIKDGSFHV